MTDTPELPPDQRDLLNEIILSYQRRRIELAENVGRRFVHYTSAEAALSIINNREVWLRNAMVMNDFSEIDHGEACLAQALLFDTETKARSERVLNAIEPELHDRLADLLQHQNNRTNRRRKTFLISLSEHGPERIVPGLVAGEGEEEFGRLSMWRAYGNTGGVALVFNSEALLSSNDTLHAYLSPVFYGKPHQFAHLWEQTLTNIERRVEQVRALPPGALYQALETLVELSSFTCKHPGFAEEREWRVTYSPDLDSEPVDDGEFNKTSAIKREIRSLNGVPQRIYKIPLKDDPALGVSGVALKDILHSVIIGPTQYPAAIFEALMAALTQAGVTDAANRIRCSLIPIRT